MAQPALKSATPAVEGTGEQTPLERAIDQYLVHLRVERGSSENTIASYARDLRRYAAYLSTLGVIDPERITTAQVRSFMRELAAPTVPLPGLAAPVKKQPGEENSVDAEEAAESLAVLIAADGGRGTEPGERGSGEGSIPLPLGPNSIARTMAAVRGAHAFWVSAFLVEKDPAATVTPPKNVKRLPKAITVEQMQRLLAVPDRDTPIGLRNRAILEFLYATGARVSEMLNADIDDVHSEETLTDEDGNDITLPGYVRLFGKGSKERLVPSEITPTRPFRITWCAAGPRSWPTAKAPPRSSSTDEAADSDARAPGSSLRKPPRRRASARTSLRTPCGTASQPTCCRAAPIFAWCRSYWGTPPSRPRRCTPRSLPRGSWRFTGWRIRVPTSGDKTPPIRGTAALEVTL